MTTERSLTASVKTELSASTVRPIHLIKAEFDSGDLRIWTGIGNITYAAEVYTGAGDAITIGSVPETVSINAGGIELTLSGLDSSILNIAQTEPYQDRKLTVWMGMLDSSGAIIADPEIVFSGRIDVMEIVEAGDKSDITVTVESRLIDIQRPSGGKYTPEDQKLSFPYDLGLDFVPTLKDREILWGGGVPVANIPSAGPSTVSGPSPGPGTRLLPRGNGETESGTYVRNSERDGGGMTFIPDSRSSPDSGREG